MLSTTLHDITGGDPEQMAALMKEFRAQLIVSIEALRSSEGQEEWQSYAHRLKGGALALGAERLARAAADAEHGLASRYASLKAIDAAFAAEMPG